MKKTFALLVFCLGQVICVWCQACPSSSDLHKLLLPQCMGVSPKGWQSGKRITVYISESFAFTQRNAIENAYYNWNTREGATIDFIPQLFPGLLPNNRRYPSSVWRLYRDRSQNCSGFLACTYPNWCANGFEHNTLTNILPTYQGTGDQLFAHEVGHTFGIDDCTAGDCLANVTIMNPYEADQWFAPMSPHCCDSRLMYQISGGSYGQSGQYCSALPVQGTSDSPGTAFLTPYPGSQTYVNATFPKNPQSGDTIIAGCLEINKGSALPTVTDNQGSKNSYQSIVGDYNHNFNSLPVALYAASQISSPQSGQFTLTCTSDWSARRFLYQ